VNIHGVVADKLADDCDTSNRRRGLAVNLTDLTSNTQRFGLACRTQPDVIAEGDVSGALRWCVRGGLTIKLTCPQLPARC